MFTLFLVLLLDEVLLPLALCFDALVICGLCGRWCTTDKDDELDEEGCPSITPPFFITPASFVEC